MIDLAVPIALVTLLMLTLLGVYVTATQFVQSRREQAGMRRRLRIDLFDDPASRAADERKGASELADSAARRAVDFYATSDPDKIIRLRQMLIRAGYMDPDAVGRYFLARLTGLGVGVAIAAIALWYTGNMPWTLNGMTIASIPIIAGYLAPTLVLMRRTAKRVAQYRNGFPDFMDLMIVCADAGMSLEASIERVSREIAKTYPSLSENLVLVSLELRAGRSIDETLKALGDRLSLDEVRAFAMLLKQSKELGTSLSGTLKVFSDEMRHKRMSKAEEKAHALPAKMTIPVTACILPVVLMMAIIPTIVKLFG